MLSADAASVDLNIDAGTMFIDASANRVGIGNTSPATALDVTGTVTSDTANIGGTIPASPDGVLAVRSDSDAHAISIYEPAGANENWQIGVDADGDLGFYNSGSTSAAVTLDDSNNVGIGTASPSTSLDVVRAGVQPLRLQSTSGTEVAINMVNTGGNVQLEAHSGNFKIDADGVGIGTASPAQPLEILKTSAAAVVPMIQLRNGSSSAGSGTSIKFMHSGVNNATSGTCELESIRYSGNLGALTFKTSNNGGTVTERMRVDDTGVGVGTSSPKTAINASTSTGAILTLESSDTTLTTNGVIGGIDFYSNDSSTNGTGAKVNIRAIGQNSSGTATALTFGTSASGSATAVEAMRIDASGNTTFKANNSAVGPIVTLENTATAVNGQAWGSIHFNSNDTSTSASGTRASIVGTSTSFNGDGNLVFSTAPSNGTNTEAMRLDASGNWMLGTTDSSLYTSSTENGLFITSTGQLRNSTNAVSAYLNRTGSDGTIVQFNKDGAAVGSIGVVSADRMYFSTADGLGLQLDKDNSRIVPVGADGSTFNNNVSLGSSGLEFKNLYLSGNATHGTTPSSSAAGVFTEAVGRTTYSSGSGTGGFSNLKFINGNGTVGTVTTSGSATAYNTSSDYRLKENVVAMSGATERLKQLKPSRFNFIADADTTVDGFLAHEVQDIVPEAISGTKDAVDEDGNPEYQGIDQSKLVPLLVATIQELEARITQLES